MKYDPSDELELILVEIPIKTNEDRIKELEYFLFNMSNKPKKEKQKE